VRVKPVVPAPKAREGVQTPNSARRKAFSPTRVNLAPTGDVGAGRGRCACGIGCPRCVARGMPVRSPEPSGALESEAERIAHRLAASAAVRPPAPDREGSLADGNGGHPLPRAAQTFFSSGLGMGLSTVRIHAGPAARSMVKDLSADAFTAGEHVFFAAERYDLSTRPGLHLLAHELVHVRQQREGVPGAANAVQCRDSDGRSSEEPQLDLTAGATSYLPYRVRPGDTLSSIARRFRVVGGWRTLFQFPFNARRIADPSAIYAGEWIAIPFEAIGDVAEANRYEAEVDLDWQAVQDQERLTRLRDRGFYPREKRVEIRVDPEPRIVVSESRDISMTMDNEPRYHVRATHVVMERIRAGDENMVTALWAAAGRAAREGLWGNLTSFKSWLLSNPLAVTEEELGRRQMKRALEIYAEQHSDRSPEELIASYVMRRRERYTHGLTLQIERKAMPQRNLYFEFDRTSFNPNLTSDEDWQETVDQLALYIQDIHTSNQGREMPYIFLDGYASFVGQPAHNQRLSERRAETVEKALVDELTRRPELDGLEYVITATGKGDTGFIVY